MKTWTYNTKILREKKIIVFTPFFKDKLKLDVESWFKENEIDYKIQYSHSEKFYRRITSLRIPKCRRLEFELTWF